MGLIKKSLKYVIATVLFVAIIVGLIFVMNYLEENPIFHKHQKENQYESNKKQPHSAEYDFRSQHRGGKCGRV